MYFFSFFLDEESNSVHSDVVNQVVLSVVHEKIRDIIERMKCEAAESHNSEEAAVYTSFEDTISSFSLLTPRPMPHASVEDDKEEELNEMLQISSHAESGEGPQSGKLHTCVT